MADEYRVPEVLQRLRDARRSVSGPVRVTGVVIPPSKLYAECEEEAARVGGGEAVRRPLYMHAMIEAGYIGAKPEPDFEPFMVCPICGYVFE